MPISVQCASCGAKLNAPDAVAGKRVKCPKCGQPLKVPALAVEPEPVDLTLMAATPPEKKVARRRDRDDPPTPERDRPALAKRRVHPAILVVSILCGLFGVAGVVGVVIAHTDDAGPQLVANPKGRPNPPPGGFDPGPFNPNPGGDPFPNPNPKVDPPEEEYKPVPLTPTDLTSYGFLATIDLPEGATVRPGSYDQITLPDGKKLTVGRVAKKPDTSEFEKNPETFAVREKTDTAILVEQKYGGLSSSWEFLVAVPVGGEWYEIEQSSFFGKKAELMGRWAVAKTLRQTDAQQKAGKARAAALAKLTAAGHTVGNDDGVVLTLSNPTADAAAVLADVPDLMAVTVERSKEPFPPDLWAKIAAVPHLRKVDGPCDDAALAALAKCRSLVALDLSYSPVTDAGLLALEPLVNLVRLQLTGCRVTGPGLAVMKKLPALSSLSLDGTPLADAGLRHLSGLPELKSLMLTGSAVTDAGVAHLTGLPNLTYLWLSGTAVTGATLNALTGSPKLESLELYASAATDAGMSKANGLSVQRVNLASTRVGDAGLAVIAKWGGLRSLTLDTTNVTDAGMAALAAAKLDSLHLSRTAVSEKGVAALGAAADLEYLFLSDCPVSDPVVATAVRFPRLKTLDLDHTDVTNAALAPLAGLPKDRRLSVSASDTRVTAAAAKAATRDGIRVAASDATPAGKAATATPPVPVAELKPADPEKLFKALKSDPDRDEDAPGKPVTGVLLSRDEPPLTDLELAEVRDLKTLTYLSVFSDKITDGGLAYLSGLTGLESLYLSTGGVTGSGFVHLRPLTKLKELNLPSLKDDRAYTADDLRPLAALQALEQVNVPRTDSARTLFAFYGQLPKLKRVMVYERVRAADLKELPPLPSVTEFRLSPRGENDSLRGPDTAGLANLKAAEVVDIGYAIDDEAATHLATVMTIRELTVNGRLLTEAGYKALAGLPELTTLRFSGGHFDAAALAAVATAPKVTDLLLNIGTLSDMTLSGLAGAKELTRLRFNGRAVTDAVIPTLAKLPNLEFVDLSQTSVTEAGIAKLREAKPDLNVRGPDRE